ncbi:ATP-binding protein [Myxococcaceae bacterium GXIMD 01537]
MPEARARIRVSRRNFLLCAACFSLGIPAHPVMFGRWEPVLVAVQVAWVLTFVLLGLALGAGRVTGRVAGTAAGLASLANLVVMVDFTGGLHSPYFPFIHTLPPIIAIFSHGERLPVPVTVAAGFAALMLMLGLSGAHPRDFLVQGLTFAFVALAALIGSQTYWKMREAEQEARRQRLDTVEQLAESERLRLLAERQRSDVERLVVVGRLAAGVAHEINNPLAYVKSNLKFLEEELLRAQAPMDREELFQLLEETQQGVLRIQQIVTDLRQFSRDSGGTEEECSVDAALAEAHRLANVRLHSLGETVLEVAPGLPRVCLGQRQLVQVMVNLLLNAADALESSPERRVARVVVRATRAEGGVLLEVEDNGPGIAPEAFARLFEPFFTTKPAGRGTGLGLALSREYVARGGGTLTAHNRPEGGARFVLTLRAVADS